jgi:hypothetical protein
MQSNVVAAMEAPFHVNPFMQMLGSMEDEWTFSTISFMKSKLGNHLNEHLNGVVGMYSQTLTIRILSHMTHVLKIWRSRSPCEHWIKLFYWDLGGFVVLIPSSMVHYQWWHLIITEARSFCHLKVKIQKLWWLFNVVCVCVFVVKHYLSIYLPCFYAWLSLPLSTFVYLCLPLSISINLYLLLFSSICFYLFPMFSFV